MKILTLENRNIKIDFDYNMDDWYRIRSLKNAEMYGRTSYSIPYSEEVLNQLQKWKFDISEDLQRFVESERERKKNFQVTGLKGVLRPFQNEGVNFMIDKHGRCLLADDQGIGKTIQAIGYLHLNRETTVIICPSSIKLNWQRELENWLNEPSIEILKGTKPYKTEAEILILNYDIATYWIEEIKRRKPEILILDEIQKIKTRTANRTKAILKLKMVNKIIGLSGTPIENRPEEIFNAGKLIRPDLFDTFERFKREFCNGTGFGHEFNGTQDTHLLNFFLKSNFMLRRLKKDVLKELPEKSYSLVLMELTNRKEYASAEADFISWVRREKGDEKAERIKNVEALAKVEGLKQLATKGKLNQVKEWIKDFLETDNKLVVFCTHTFVVDELMKEFECAVKIDGSTRDRQKPVDMFQNDPKTRLFVGNIKAAGEGITLTASSNVAIIEFPWSPSNIDQASDRVHRITQKNAVMVYYLLAQNTIEEKIAKLLDKKRKMIASAMNGTEAEQSELLEELINSYKT